jgi:hypothetical protein
VRRAAGQRLVLDHLRRGLEAAGAAIHAADMADQQILRDRATGGAAWRIEIGAAGLEAAAGEDLVIGQRHFRHVVGELVGVPARLVVVAVHVDRAEDAERVGQRQLVLEGMAGQDRVALLDIDLHLVLQPVAS